VNALQTFARDIWIADGPMVRSWGTSFPTPMSVVLSDGSLWVNSPVAATRDQGAWKAAEIDQLLFRGSIVLSETEFFHSKLRI
jgi:hypothetical protein